MIQITLTRFLPRRFRAAKLISLIEETPNLSYIATRLEELRDNEEINALTTKKQLYNLVRDMPDAIGVLDALFALRPHDIGLKAKVRPFLINPKPENFATIQQSYIGPDGQPRQPLTKYLPMTIYQAFLQMNDNYINYLASEYDPAKPKRPGLIIVSGYRSPWYQAAVYIIGVTDKGVGGMYDHMTLPGYSGHSSIKKCAIDLTHLGDANGLRTNIDGSEIGFEDTVEFAWLMKHAPSHGFWLPYPPGNKDGIIFEPWHWQYVGSAKKAQYLMKKHKVAAKMAGL